MPKVGNQAMCISVNGDYTTSPTNLHLWDYTGAVEQGWTLLPADDKQVGAISLFATDKGSYSIELFRGHAFVTIYNSSDTPIPMGALEIPPGVEMSFGTWDLDNHSGIIYNLETSKSANDHNDYTSITSVLKGNDIKILNDIIDVSDFWTYDKNCSYFAVNMWNAASSTYKFHAFQITTPTELLSIMIGSGEILVKGRLLKRVTPIGFVKNGVFVDRSAYN